MIVNSLFFPDYIVHALGWTLLHALWQGGLLAFLVWVLRPRQSKSLTRYRTAYGALIIQLLAGIATFFAVLEVPVIIEPVPSAQFIVLWPEAPLSAGIPETVPHSLADRFQAFHPLIVTLWLAGMAFFLIRLLGGLWFLHRIRQHGRQPADDAWSDRLKGLQARIAFSQPIRLIESALVRTPMTIGFFKPVVMIPLAMANQLQPEEVEAILAHELAHILRRDWLMNLGQILIESLFYYHPAIWWLSSIVRAEREHCCDDFAVSLTGSPLHYARTLVRIQEISKPAPVPSLALGFAGTGIFLRRRTLLLERIHRLLQPQQQKFELMEKLIVSAMLVAALAFWSVRSGKTPFTGTLQAGNFGYLMPGTGGPPDGIAQDSVPPPKKRQIQRIIKDDGNQRVELELEGGAIQKLVVDGKEIAPEDYGKYEQLTNEVLADIPPPPPPPPAPVWDGAAPSAPDAPSWHMRTPAPPAPPVRISREQDSKGNTVIRLEQHGAPVEIVVNDGEVIVNGQALIDGGSLALPGVKGNMIWIGEEGHVLELEPGKSLRFHDVMPSGEHEIRVIELDRREKDLRNIEVEVRRAQRDMEHQQRKIEVEVRDAQREAEHQRRKIEVEVREVDEHQRMAREEGRRAREHAQEIILREVGGHPSKMFFIQGPASLNDALRDQLLEDGLISDPNEYKIELSGKYLKVNGKKQPVGVHRRYLDIYEQYNGRPMGEQDIIRIVEDDD